jgi:light-regulated signal transduction histidine kinase (bacteriophytochrome)
MRGLLDDLLIYSRTKHAVQQFEKADLNIVLKDVEKSLEEIIAQKKAKIESVSLGEANIIRFQFSQVLQNLISNSLKFAKPGIRPHIIIKSETINGSKLADCKLNTEIDYCHISYTDNGIGFDPQYKDRIFEVFQRLHSTDKYEGTGMGLAICKMIIENHKGAMTATGTLNEGARFDIYIPAS